MKQNNIASCSYTTLSTFVSWKWAEIVLSIVFLRGFDASTKQF